MIRASGASANLDFAIIGDGDVFVTSFYGRALMNVKSVAANMNLIHSHFDVGGEVFHTAGLKYDSFIQPITTGKEKFYHCMVLKKQLKENCILTTAGRAPEDFFHYLMNNFSYPLLKEWGSELLEEAMDSGYLYLQDMEVIRGEHSLSNHFHLRGEDVCLDELQVYSVYLNEESLKVMIRRLFEQGRIRIAEEPQKKLEFKDMDSYFREYGSSIVENLRNTIQPLTELDGNVRDFALKSIRLYPQQIAQVNGQIELMAHSKYGILNHGMGTGKTVSCASIIEGYYARRWMKSHPGKGLKELYQDPDALNYRVILMCPGHLVGATCYRT